MDGDERRNAGEEASRHGAHLFARQRVARRGTRGIHISETSTCLHQPCLCRQFAVSSARLAVMGPGAESWAEVSCVVAGRLPFLAYKECGKPEELRGKRPVGRSETQKGNTWSH